MINLHTWGTPNGRKVSIALEEMGLPYTVFPVDITRDEQFRPEFLAIAPNNRIPAIVDHDTGARLFESGAILMYLAEKTGQFWPQTSPQKWQVIQWLMWQIGGVGPMLGQVHHFVKYNPGKAPYAEERFLAEGKRLYGVLDRRLAQAEFVAGDYSIADMAIFPWIARHDWQSIDIAAYPNVVRWYRAIAARLPVQRGYNVPESGQAIPLIKPHS